MTQEPVRAPSSAGEGGSDPSTLSSEEVSVVLSALWIWRAQLGRVGSRQSVPGMGTAADRAEVGEIARKLGGDPDAFFFGLDPGQRR